MSVAVKKIDGVQSVNVSLNTGVVTIDLVAGNHLTMVALRKVITSNGFSPKEATVVVDGMLDDHSGTPTLRVDGTDERIALTPSASAPNVMHLLSDRARVEIGGRIDPSPGMERLAVASVKRAQ